MTPPLTIRAASERDADQILAIMNREIRERWAHFSLVEVTRDELLAIWAKFSHLYPWFVACDGDTVLAYAHASEWKPRGAYAWTTEIGVYVDPGHQGRGIGKLLYSTLIPDLERRGYRTLVAGIALPNDASVKLHESFGMSHIGTFPRVGYKHGQWRAVGYWWRTLGDESDSPPDPITPTSDDPTARG